MTEETLMLYQLHKRISDLPEGVEIFIWNKWRELEYVADYQIINGSWIGLDDQIEVAVDGHDYVYSDTREVTIRYEEIEEEPNEIVNIHHIEDFHKDESHHGEYRLEMRSFDNRHIVFELDLVSPTETRILDYMVARDYPEMMELYDFTAKQWVDSELSEFWDGLQVCLR